MKKHGNNGKNPRIPSHSSLPFPRSFSIGALIPQRTATQDATIIPTINSNKMLRNSN
jgi:hypothetical protein